MIPTFLLLFMVALILYAFISTIKPRKFPPGPVWYPFIGSSGILQKMSKKYGSEWRACLELSRQYSTNVLGMKLSTELLVIVFGEKNVRQVFNDKEFDARPHNFFSRLRCLGNKNTGITFANGEIWKIHRQFAVKNLKHVGYGKTAMETEIQNELSRLLSCIKESNSKPINFVNLLSESVINVLWKYVAGERIKEDKLKHLLDLFRQRGKAFSVAGGMLNQMPWCRFIIPKLSGYSLIIKLNREISKVIEIPSVNISAAYVPPKTQKSVYDAYFQMLDAYLDDTEVERFYLIGDFNLAALDWDTNISNHYTFGQVCGHNAPVGGVEAIEKHKDKKVEGNDFIYLFLEEIYANKNPTFTEEQLKMVCLDFLIAGSQTSSSLLGFAFLKALKCQEIQQKIYQEIDTVIGDRTPCWNDNDKLVYTSAFIQEVHRYYPIVPMAGPRLLQSDSSIDGYLIPKGATILMSVGDIYFDPELWDEPHVFKPERFIDESGMLKNSEHLYHFGLGRRRCPGDSLAKSFIFITFVGILQKYRIHVSNGTVPSDVPIIGILSTPRPYTAEFTLRK